MWVFGKGGGDPTRRRGQLTVVCIEGGEQRKKEAEI